MREDPRYPDAIGSGSGGDVFRRKLQEYDSTSGQYFYSKVDLGVLSLNAHLILSTLGCRESSPRHN